jgi:hypothetical protein
LHLQVDAAALVGIDGTVPRQRRSVAERVLCKSPNEAWHDSGALGDVPAQLTREGLVAGDAAQIE